MQVNGSWLIIIKPINEEKYSIKPHFLTMSNERTTYIYWIHAHDSNMTIVFGPILTASGFLASAVLIWVYLHHCLHTSRHNLNFDGIILIWFIASKTTWHWTRISRKNFWIGLCNCRQLFLQNLNYYLSIVIPL